MEQKQNAPTLQQRIRSGKLTRADVARRLAELAFGKGNDCVRLALETDPAVEKLDLTLLSEIRRNEKGMVEIKLADRLKALQQLAEMVGEDKDGAEAFLRCPALSGPCVALSLQEYDENGLKMAADVYVPTALGGTACEKTALEVADAMTYLMARCQVGPIRYDGQMGLFTVRVLVTWTRTTFSIVRVDGEQVAQVVDFSATRKQVRLPYVTEDGQQTQVTVGGIQWTVTVVDELPRDEMAENDKTGAFTLTVEREGGSETYPGCVWTQVTLEDRKNAIRRIRVAESNQERVVTAQ